MLVLIAYWLFIGLTAIGKLVAFATLLVFAIALPLARIRTAEKFGQAAMVDLAIVGFGILGLFVLLENLRIFLTAA